MNEEGMQPPDPAGQPSGQPEKATPGASPGGQPGAGGDPRDSSMGEEPPAEEPFEDVTPEAPPPPPKESESRDGSDIDGVSNRDAVQSLESKDKEPGSSVDSDVYGKSNKDIVQCIYGNLLDVSLSPDPAAREFLEIKAREVKAFVRLLKEKEDLQSRDKAEIQRLQQELQEAKKSQKTRNLSFTLPWSKTDFHIQVLVTGRTEHCETQFLKKVSGLLSEQSINLKTERYREGSGRFLLVFCPVSSRVGTDMGNALEGLQGELKAVLVVLHHKPKESTSFVDTMLQAHHPAVVRTVHARYTVQEGFYSCPMNDEAVAVVAEVLEDHCKGGKGERALPRAPSKSWKLH